MMRRIFGILSMLLMFHLSVASGDVACGSHGRGHAAAAMDGMGSMAHGSHSANADGPSAPRPAMPDCCAAMSSCAVVMVAAPGRASVPVPRADECERQDESLARSHIGTPETPPPRV